MSATRQAKITAILGGSILFGCLQAHGTRAESFNAEKVMKGMNAEERFAFVAGVVEGLAIARFNKDGKKKEGMACIYAWFYDDKDSFKAVLDAFSRYPAYPPGSIVDVLVKRKCGEG